MNLPTSAMICLVSFPPIATLCFDFAYLMHLYACFVSSFGIFWHFPVKKEHPLNQPSMAFPRNREWYRPFLALQGFSCTVLPGVGSFRVGKGKILIDYPSIGCLPRMLLEKALSNFFLHLLHFLDARWFFPNKIRPSWDDEPPFVPQNGGHF